MKDDGLLWAPNGQFRTGFDPGGPFLSVIASRFVGTACPIMEAFGKKKRAARHRSIPGDWIKRSTSSSSKQQQAASSPPRDVVWNSGWTYLLTSDMHTKYGVVEYRP